MATNVWSQLLAKWLSRADVVRVSETALDSVFLGVSVLTNKAGRVAYIGSEGETEGGLCFGELPLPDDVLPVFRVQSIEYGAQTVGSKLFSGVKRWFERKQETYVVGDIGADGSEMFGVLAVWGRERAKDALPAYDGFEYTQQKPGMLGLDNADLASINSAIDKTISRINRNLASLDSRKELWNGATLTAFGCFRKQQRDERKAKAAA